ncbi:TolC family protein [Acinetobacter sp. MB5]|uniref:TolC family protein n=1 Tax=Acinetobacter sp. MB5 TaxID=2069438 RepID=UPI001D0D93A4|nr:TolC family protein [Acinetobacter sp. MB5]
MNCTYAEDSSWKNFSAKDLIRPRPDDSYKTINLANLSKFNVTAPNTPLPIVGQPETVTSGFSATNRMDISPLRNGEDQSLDLNQAVLLAIQRNPTIRQSIAELSQQSASIDVARASYYPSISAGMETGDLTSANKGEQVYTIKATQMLYDFGQVKASVDIEKAKLVAEQANVLVAVDEIATDTSRDVLAIRYYRNLVNIAQQQIKGMQRLYNIALLRANAGISSRADPVQAQSYVAYAQSYLITQQSSLRQTEQKLRTLLGFDVSQMKFTVSSDLVTQSGLYRPIQFNNIPQMIAAKAEIDVSSAQKEQTRKSIYPKISLVGSVSHAINGINPDSGKRNGTDPAVYLSVSSTFYQGGQVQAQLNAANYAEQAAQAKLDSTYLDVLNTTRTAQELIENTQRQIDILIQREKITHQTRELYEDQYKLGTRSILDLLSAEQSYQSARIEKEQAIYTIYDTIAQYISTTGKSRDVYQINNKNIQGVELQQ